MEKGRGKGALLQGLGGDVENSSVAPELNFQVMEMFCNKGD